MSKNEIRILVVGPGHMGLSHARAYKQLENCTIVGMVSRSINSRDDLDKDFPDVPRFENYEKALQITKPDAVSINTFADTHADFAIKAFEAGAHVFVEKPLARTVAEAKEVVAKAVETNKKLVVGYILRHHPAWKQFTEVARGLGKPLVMRMNLVQQVSGPNWAGAKNMLNTAKQQPIVDCGIHYVDIMCQMTQSRPIKVHAMGVKLSDDVAVNNYGQLQVFFEDGSVGWYEASYSPCVSEEAFFVKDIVGPKGAVSIVNKHDDRLSERETDEVSASGDIETHTQANYLKIHHSELDENDWFVKPDEMVETEQDPGHDGLCLLEQAYFLKAIRENIDLSRSMEEAVSSLQIVLAADESCNTGEIVRFD